jgi:hypothetical protein
VLLGTSQLVHPAVARQTAYPPVTPHPSMPASTPEDTMDPGMKARVQEQRDKFANDDRHKRLVDDTAKLLALSTELKLDVDKAGKDQLSVEVIRKAGEIEKLAHDVKERMKN